MNSGNSYLMPHRFRIGCTASGSRMAAITDDHHDRGGGSSNARVPMFAVKADDERDQIETQRHDPEKGNDGHVLADLIGHGQQAHRAECGQQQPHQTAANGYTVLRGGAVLCRIRYVRRRQIPAHHGQGQPATQHRKGQKPDDHSELCDGMSKAGSITNGYESSAAERSEIRQRVEAIGESPLKRSTVPGLHQRRGSGEQEIGQPDIDGQQQQDPPLRLAAVGRFPRGTRARSAAPPRRPRAAPDGSGPGDACGQIRSSK